MSVPGTYFTSSRWLRGRARRREYALSIAVILPWAYVAEWAANPWVSMVLSWALVLQSIRRLHDIGVSGWWFAWTYLAALVLASLAATYPEAPAAYWPALLFPALALILATTLPGQKSANRFGPPPAPDQASRIPAHPSH